MTTKCPNCQQTHGGFVAGTCCQCGFNYISNTFDWISAYVDELPIDIRNYLIRIHENRTKKPPVVE